MARSAPPSPSRRRSLVDVNAVCGALEKLAPLSLAQTWDNVGLLAGDRSARVARVLLCIDLVPDVVVEAVAAKTQLIMAYHPPIFKPIFRLVRPDPAPEAEVHECIRHGIAIYSMHTALDAAEGGTNDVIAGLCGLDGTEPIEHADPPPDRCKLVVFVPAAETDRVAEAMFAAGAGRIGDYERCSFRMEGTGTFFGADSTRPAVGQAGRLERVEEVRLEAVCPADRVPAVVDAMVQAHSYEEPAYDIYPVKGRPARGIGRVGRLRRPTTLRALARRLRRAVGADCTTVVGAPDAPVERVIVAVGAAGTLPFAVGLGERDVVVTGEIRHHDALAIRRRGGSAIALSHWASERPALAALASRLAALLPGAGVSVSKRDCDPFQRV